MIDRFERFTLSIFNIARYWNRIAAEEMKKYGLKGTFALYLVAMSNCETEITAAKLAVICHRDKADVSRAMAAFQEQGIVERCGEINYRAPLVLTKKGNELCAKIKARAELALKIAGDGVTEEMRSNMYECLDLITANIKTIYEKGLPEE